LTECVVDRCTTTPWNDGAERQWIWAYNSASGSVGTTPEDVP